MEPVETTEVKSSIKIDDLLVGENKAMNTAAMAWGTLYKIDRKYLTMFIARMEKDQGTQSQLALPLFKMVLFFAEHMQDHANKDPKIKQAIDEAQARYDMQKMFGGPEDF
jgi:hypothetical protein